ncbi:DUF6804 family protein [Flagellimonas sp. DF-77]|uniref:DUF6804 family protein n=1 Tax=Flagellimonas algarum TaxID=3230298 RepID=UPI00339664DE
MNKKLFANVVRIISVCCAILLFVAVLPAPRDYYWVLRTVVSLGAVLVILQNFSKPHWIVLFGVILVLFNPIFPIYLYKKILWMPIDIVTGLLFLIEIILNRPKKLKPTPVKKGLKKYERDKIY